MYYLRLRQTYGEGIVTDINDPKLKYVSVDFAKDYGIKTLTETQLLKFAERLEKADNDYVVKYITEKAGFDPNIANHTQLAVKIYTQDGLIQSNYSNVLYVCIMSEGLTQTEVRLCQERKQREAKMAEQK